MYRSCPFWTNAALCEVDGNQVTFHSGTNLDVLRSERRSDKLDINRHIFLNDFCDYDFRWRRRGRLFLRAANSEEHANKQQTRKFRRSSLNQFSILNIHSRPPNLPRGKCFGFSAVCPSHETTLETLNGVSSNPFLLAQGYNFSREAPMLPAHVRASSRRANFHLQRFSPNIDSIYRHGCNRLFFIMEQRVFKQRPSALAPPVRSRSLHRSIFLPCRR